MFVELSQPALQNTKLAWVNMDWLTGSDNFYFKKRQWLADARTIVAGVRFLYESRKSGEVIPADLAAVPALAPSKMRNANSHSRIENPAS